MGKNQKMALILVLSVVSLCMAIEINRLLTTLAHDGRFYMTNQRCRSGHNESFTMAEIWDRHRLEKFLDYFAARMESERTKQLLASVGNNLLKLPENKISRLDRFNEILKYLCSKNDQIVAKISKNESSKLKSSKSFSDQYFKPGRLNYEVQSLKVVGLNPSATNSKQCKKLLIAITS